MIDEQPQEDAIDIDPELLREERERTLNIVLEDVYPIAEAMLAEGVMIPSMIAGLVLVAKQVAAENTDAVGDEYFEECLRDILAGKDGLNVGKYAAE